MDVSIQLSESYENDRFIGFQVKMHTPEKEYGFFRHEFLEGLTEMIKLFSGEVENPRYIVILSHGSCPGYYVRKNKFCHKFNILQNKDIKSYTQIPPEIKKKELEELLP